MRCCARAYIPTGAPYDSTPQEAGLTARRPVPITQTEQKLADITDEGYFEKLATAVLREANPAYAAVIHTVVNAAGRTVRSPVDGIVIRTDMNPPRLYGFQYTTTRSQKNLASKWLEAEKGDIAKVGKIYAKARQTTPEMTAELVLTSNQEPDSDTGVAVGVACVAARMHQEIWGRGRLAHFLDLDLTRHLQVVIAQPRR